MGGVDERMAQARRERMARARAARTRPALWREQVGALLRRERLAQERILVDVARDAGVSTQYLSEIERGMKEPSSEILGAVAGALGLTLLDVAAGVAEHLGADHAGREQSARAAEPTRAVLMLAA